MNYDGENNDKNCIYTKMIIEDENNQLERKTIKEKVHWSQINSYSK